MKRVWGGWTAASLGLWLGISLGLGGAARAEEMPPERDVASDQAAQIMTRLKKDPDLAHNRIGVTVDHAVATLTGTVDSQREKSEAARLALVNGIIGVDNRLEVGSATLKASVIDSAVTAEIKAKLAGHELSTFNDVSVTTNNGVVTLAGTVPSREARDQVVDIVRATDDVTRIEDQLIVAPVRR
ncbi:MAG TPA: BON domain-containing protein [Polyangia bacterium]|nr:BON domain-containing protein [Polyangia bacterium]